MKSKEYVEWQIERTRGQLRAKAFIQMSKNSLTLRGKRLSHLLEDLSSNEKKPLELIDAAAFSNAENIEEGAIVSLSNIFESNEGMTWDGTDIRFQTADGMAVSPDQYAYLQHGTLGPVQMFAETDQWNLNVKSVWKSMSRVAREARTDKAKEIFYMTFGELVWEIDRGKKDAKSIKSPLFILPIKEEAIKGTNPKYKITNPRLKQNSVLRREVMKETGLNIYEGCKDDISLSEVEDALLRVLENVRDYIGYMKVESDAYHLCILDSHDEALCQAVEKNMEAITASPLTRVIAGEIPYIAPEPEKAERPIYPLPADESQKQVIDAVLGGESIYAPAPAGAGKSQTSVNIAANLAIRGKSVCVMSEKLAANEVFLDYASKIGLSQYCLSLHSGMKTSDIVKQIKSIVKIKRQYVRTDLAEETLRRSQNAIAEYEKLNRELYATDPSLRISLYELISTAVTAEELSFFPVSAMNQKVYLDVKGALMDLQSGSFEIMTDLEFEDYFYRGVCEDTELVGMLEKANAFFAGFGLDLPRIISENRLRRAEAVSKILSNLARHFALELIGESELFEIGNRKVKSVYKSLADAHLQIQDLYISYMQQELSAHIAERVDDKFVSTLEKLKLTKVTPQELFAAYGKEILAICPIVVTTPTAASNYIYGSGADEFHTMLIDEASQMQIISILPYMDRLRQLVVFGDGMQLGITSTFMKKDLTVDADTVKDTAYTDRSVLQAVEGRFPSRSLKYHYRSGTEMLIHVSNKTCYDGLLEVVPDIYTSREALPSHLGWEVIQVSPPDSVQKGTNESEARVIVERAEALLQEYPDKSIGIIAFNEKQQELISDMLEEQIGCMDEDRIWTRSLENAQGKEADFVFSSICHCRRNRDGSLHKGISEINRVGGENRLNVLFTRARCKNFIVLSFDYRELKKSENTGIRRLYEYIDYAMNGGINETVTTKLTNADHAMIRAVSNSVTELHSSYRAAIRIGSENMAVDIAVKDRDNAKYSLGIIIPSVEQTPQEAMTKLLVLERAGWHLSPISPIYFLSSKEAFRSQLLRDMTEPLSFTSKEHLAFDTYRPPDRIFSFSASQEEQKAEKDSGILPICEDDFIHTDFEKIYAPHISGTLLAKSTGELNVMAKSGDAEATLLLLLRLKERYIHEGKRGRLLALAHRLYAIQRERRAAYFLAALLRLENKDNHKDLIEQLLLEAQRLGIGGE